MAERTTVRLPPQLLAQAKRKAAAEGRTLTALIEEGLRNVVAEKPVERSPRIMPRLSTARGGIRPGFDPRSFSAIQEIEDEEYIERLKSGFR